MQGPSGENEPKPPESPSVFDEAKAQFVGELLGIIGFLATAYVINLRQTNTDFRLPALHAVIRTLQTTARVLGSWAINLEKTYNEIAESLH